MKKLIISLLLLLHFSSVDCFAEEYKDPATNVIYTYDPAGNRAEVKQGTYVFDDSGEVFCDYSPGSPDVKDDIVILDKFTIDGKEYIVDRIGDNAFIAKRITSVVIPASVKSIGDRAFYYCSSLPDIVFPDGLTSIGMDAFEHCGLKNLSFPESLQAIGPSAFCLCRELETVSLPASLKMIDPTAFLGCDGLTNITVADGNPSFDSRDNCNAVIETSSNKLLLGCKGTHIPATVVSVGKTAFTFNQGMESIDIPGSVEEIGDSAFFACQKLKQVTLSEGLKVIGKDALSITGLSSVTIPSTVSVIGQRAFNCNALSTITSLIREPFEVQEIFGSLKRERATLYVPSGTKSKYESIQGWSGFKSIVELPEPVTFTEGQMATIVLPTAPEASKGKYYRLDRVEGNEIIFEQELQPRAHIPYIIVPGEDFYIEHGTLDLNGLSRDTVSIDGVSFIGTYQKEEIESKEGFYFEIIDATPDCILSGSRLKVGALRAFLQVHWAYIHGGTIAPAEKMQIVLHDYGTGVEGIQSSKFKIQNEDAAIFDLSGRRLSNGKLPHGIYIEDGRKKLK